MGQTEYVPLGQLISRTEENPEEYTDFLEELDFFEEIVLEALYHGRNEFVTEEPICNEALDKKGGCRLKVNHDESEGKIEWNCEHCDRRGVITEFDNYKEAVNSEMGPFDFNKPEYNIVVEFPEELFRWFKKARLDLPDQFQDTVFNSASYNDGYFYWEAGFSVLQSLNGLLEIQKEKLSGEDQDKAGKMSEIISTQCMEWMHQVLLGYVSGELSDEDLNDYFAGYAGLNELKKEFDKSKNDMQEEADRQGISVQELVEQMRFNNLFEGLNSNNGTNEDLGNLSNHQYLNLITNDWTEKTAGMILGTGQCEPSELEKTPVIRNLRLFTKLILENREALPLTQQGNLRQKDVIYLLDEGVWMPGYVEEVKELYKTINELDAFEVHEFRVVLTLAKLLRKSKGKLIIMKKNKSLLERGSAGRLYKTLFTTWMQHFYFGYRMGETPEIDDFQQNVPFYLYRLSQLPEQGTISELAEQIHFPVPQIYYGDGDSGHSQRAGILHIHLIRPLFYFGMMDIGNKEGVSSLSRYDKTTYHRTEMFDKIIRFNL